MKVAVVGYGRWGANHARVMNNIANLVCIIDTDESRQDLAHKTYPGVTVTGDYHAAEMADAVVVATPASTHYEITADLLDAGKHVLCEKPLCLTWEEAKDLHERARTVLRTGYIYLFNNNANWIRENLPDNLSAIHSLHTHLGPIRSDVNVVYDLAVHNLALQQYWIGSSPALVSATGLPCIGKNDDIAAISAIYPGAVHASVFASWITAYHSREIVLTGDTTIVWNDSPGGNLWVHTPGGTEYTRSYPPIPFSEPLLNEDEAYLRAIKNRRNNTWMCSLDLGVMATLEAVNRSINAFGEPEPVRRER